MPPIPRVHTHALFSFHSERLASEDHDEAQRARMYQQHKEMVMGNCIVSVHVTGGHHNRLPSDIDQLAHAFVAELKVMGHNVTAATIVTGGENDLLNTASRLPLKG